MAVHISDSPARFWWFQIIKIPEVDRWGVWICDVSLGRTEWISGAEFVPFGAKFLEARVEGQERVFLVYFNTTSEDVKQVVQYSIYFGFAVLTALLLLDLRKRDAPFLRRPLREKAILKKGNKFTHPSKSMALWMSMHPSLK